MPRTAAQRAARRRRRLKKRGMLGPVIMVAPRTQGARKSNLGASPKKKKRRVRQKKANRQGEISATGKVNALNSLATDGVNASRVIVNNSTIEDTFQVRREKVANISGSSAFTVAQQLYINPGNSVLFPIFSQIASTYEEYRLNVCYFTFETEAYTASGSNLGAGKVIQVTNFDPDDGNFSSDTAAENYSGAVRGPPYASTCHDVLEAHKLKGRAGSMRDFSLNNYFVYASANQLAPVTGQAKFYDAGNYQLITQGNAGTSEMGELYVTYSFTMIRPKQPEAGSGGFLAAHFKNSAADATDASPLGLTSFTSFATQTGSTLSIVNGATLSGYSSTTIGLNDSSDAVMNMPNTDGTWMVQIYWTGATIAAIPTIVCAGGCSILNTYGASAAPSGFFLAAGTKASWTGVVTTTFDATPNPGATNIFTISGGLTGMTGARVDIYIIRLPSALTTVSRSLPFVCDDSRDSKRVDYLCEQVERLTKRLALLSPCESPVEHKEAELEKSVHISRAEARKFGLFG